MECILVHPSVEYYAFIRECNNVVLIEKDNLLSTMYELKRSLYILNVCVECMFYVSLFVAMCIFVSIESSREGCILRF